MSRSKRLTRDEILSIPPLLEEGYTYEQIGAKFGVTKLSIARWVSKLKFYGYEVPKIKRGRPTML